MSLYQRLSVGSTTVTQLFDGAVRHALAQSYFAINVDPGDFEAIASAEGLATDAFDFSATVTVVEADGRRILIDTGFGPAGRPTAGLLPDAMQAAGIEPDTISYVVLSHLHMDHVGGLLDEAGDPVFPKARHWVSPLEKSYWLGPASHTVEGASTKRLMDALDWQLLSIAPGDELVRGFRIVDCAGHTPGHIGVLLESEGERLFIASDIANHRQWSMAHPHWHMRLDINPGMAASVRVSHLGWLADEGILMAGYHMPFPALGHIVRHGDGFDFVPLDKAALP